MNPNYPEPCQPPTLFKPGHRLLLSLLLLGSALTASAQNPLTNGLVAYYPFNGNVHDVSGSGIIATVRNGENYVASPIGSGDRALSFGGALNSVSLPDDVRLRNVRTVSAWFYCPVYPSLNGPIAFRGDARGGNDPFQVGIKPSGVIDYTINAGFGGITAGSLVSDNPVGLNAWHHMVVTYADAGGVMALFLDGVLLKTTAGVTAPVAELNAGSDPGWGIGNHAGLTQTIHNQQFTGSIDEVRFYDRPLNAAEVSALYALEKPDALEFGLVAYYPFNGNANDASGGGKHGVVNGATLGMNRFGQANSAYDFNGASFIDFPSGQQLGQPNTAFTVSLWVKASGLGPILGDYEGTATGGDEVFALHIAVDNNPVHSSLANYLAITSRNAPTLGLDHTLYISDSPLIGSGWHFVAYVMDGVGTCRVIVDGVLKATLPYNAALNYNQAPRLQAGRLLFAGQQQFFTGSIDDIRIYNRALSAADLTYLYATEATTTALTLFPVLTIAGATGGNYRIEATSDLVNTSVWTTLTNLTLPSSPFDFIDKSTPQPLRRFYRAIPVP